MEETPADKLITLMMQDVKCPDIIDRKKLEQAVQEFIKYYADRGIKSVTNAQVLPDFKNILRAFKFVPSHRIHTIIIGQDPFPNKEDACGLAFSSESRVPVSTRNIYKALIKSHLMRDAPNSGNLVAWCNQGVLLLNIYLTKPLLGSKSDMHKFWRSFTRSVLDRLESDSVNLVMWGREAQGINVPNLDMNVIEYAHPAASAYGGQDFADCDSFTRVNANLAKYYFSPVDWDPRSTIIWKTPEITPGIGKCCTDGACPNNGKPGATGGWAFSYMESGGQNRTRRSGKLADRMMITDVNGFHYGDEEAKITNNRAELTALIQLLYEKVYAKMRIVTDSTYVIKVVTSIQEGRDVPANPDLVTALRMRMLDINSVASDWLEMVHIESHLTPEEARAKKYDPDDYSENRIIDDLAATSARN